MQVEQSDLIRYGLIPEFVGRFPVVSTLQVGRLLRWAGPALRQLLPPLLLLLLPPLLLPLLLWLLLLPPLPPLLPLLLLPPLPSFRASQPPTSRLTLSPPPPAAPQALSEDELAHVLCEPKNALVKQYAGIFAKNSVK